LVLYSFPDFGLLLWPPVRPGGLCLNGSCYAQYQAVGAAPSHELQSQGQSIVRPSARDRYRGLAGEVEWPGEGPEVRPRDWTTRGQPLWYGDGKGLTTANGWNSSSEGCAKCVFRDGWRSDCAALRRYRGQARASSSVLASTRS